MSTITITTGPPPPMGPVKGGNGDPNDGIPASSEKHPQDTTGITKDQIGSWGQLRQGFPRTSTSTRWTATCTSTWT